MAKRYPVKLKFQVVLELPQGDKTPGQVAKANGLHPNSAGKLQQQFLEKGGKVFAHEATIADYERRIGELEQRLGKNEGEIAHFESFLGRNSKRRRKKWPS